MSFSIEEKINAFCRQKELFRQGDRILVGLSGGADSVCLFLILLELSKEWKLTLVPVHINHNIRGDAAQEDERFCKELCLSHGLHLHVESVPVEKLARENGWTLEEAGRNVRYRVFAEYKEKYGCDRIAVAHHKNDQTETVLFQLFRGSRLKGLSGMAAENGAVIRPLLCVTRKEIESYLREKNQQFCIDHTNFEEEYTRNLIRHQMIPAAERIQPRAVEHVAETADYISRVEAYLEKLSGELYGKAVREETECVLVSVTELAAADALLAERVMYEAISCALGKKKDITAVYVASCMELLKKQTGRYVQLPEGVIAKRNFDVIRIGRERTENREFFLEITEYPFETELPDGTILSLTLVETDGKTEEFIEKTGGIPNCTYTKWFDCDKINSSVSLRTPALEDEIVIYTDGRKKKVLDVLTEARIPKEERCGYLLLAEGNRALWLPGVRGSEAYRISKETKRILIAKINGGNEHG